MANKKPILGITMGDPAGIGPEIAAKVISKKETFDVCRPIVIGDAVVMKNVLEIANVLLEVNTVSNVFEAKFAPGVIDVFDLRNVDIQKLEFGKISAMAGNASFESIKKAIDLALKGELDGTVTGPIQKESMNLAGHQFPGHTEIYATFTDTKDFAMLLAYEDLRVIHVSTHVPLRDVHTKVKKGRILKVIELLHEACQSFGVESPKIGVAGLNPHASDGGLFGKEEKEQIIPAIKAANRKGYMVEGPYPPDVLFPMMKGGYFDGCVAMYHDQGHIPFKLIGFEWNNVLQRMENVRGVNITLGLPIIRTSVDHGTAFEIAGKGVASTEALELAIDYAAKLAIGKKFKTP